MLAGGAFGYVSDYLLWWVLLISLFVHIWCFFTLFPRDKHPKLGLVLGNALVFLGLLGTAAMIGETYLRFVCVQTDSFGMSLPARRWFERYVQFNSLECRDREWMVKKPEGVRRIAFVGDSFTYGWGIEHVEDRFTDRVQAMFDRESPGSVEVMNVAKPGWGTRGQMAAIGDVINRFDVDEIVLCYVLNDLEKLLPRTADFDPIRPPEPRLFDLDRSCLLDHLYRIVWVPRVPTVRGYHDWLAEGYANEQIWRRQERQLGDIMRYCRDEGVTFRAVLLPFIRTGGTKFDGPGLHDHMRRFFESNQVEVLDLLEVINGVDAATLMVNRHDAHPNEVAHQLFADAIWRSFYSPTTR